MSMILIRNADVYAPEPLGRRDLLLGGGKVLWIGTTGAPDLPAGFGGELGDHAVERRGQGVFHLHG
ncbi:MAG TPA: hypothetical protein PLO34_01780, partial [Pseudoxanthomonas sp.]|nr:hypothetical protein [Pseudoxanthomonas sp.]